MSSCSILSKQAALAWLAAAALSLSAGAAWAQTTTPAATPDSLPARLAIVPFRCLRPCAELMGLQQELVDRLVEAKAFELLLDEQTEEIFLGPARYRTALDSLTARASRNLEPDSTTGVNLARRFEVDGFLLAHQTFDGPVVEIWSAPAQRIVFRYQAGRVQRGYLPDAQHESADTKRAQPMTGGISSSGSSGSASNKGSSTQTEATPQLPQMTDTGTPILVNTKTDVSERTRELAETISNQIVKIRRAGMREVNPEN